MKIQSIVNELIDKEPNRTDLFLATKESIELLLKTDTEYLLNIWEFVRDTSYVDTEIHTNPEFLFMDGFKEGVNFDNNKAFHAATDSQEVKSFNALDDELSPIDWGLMFKYMINNPTN